MVKRESKVLLVIVFLFGCFASHVARTNLDVPPARAQTAPTQTSAPRWEYACEWIDDLEEEGVARLNQYGVQGWELVSAFGVQASKAFCLKRPL